MQKNMFSYYKKLCLFIKKCMDGFLWNSDYERIYLIIIKYMRYCSLLYVRIQMFLGYQLFEMSRTR